MIKFLFSLHSHVGILIRMNSHTIISIPVLSGEAFESSLPSIQVYIRYLESRVQQLEARVHELEARISKDSSNSSKPPTSDGLKRKPKSLRGRSGKKPGGQQGRTGKGLARVSNPDTIVTHAPASCSGCGFDLNAVQGSCAEQRQVFDIPQPKITVTEHRVEEKKCPCCGEIVRASFPENIKGPVQYGDRIRALIAYFSHEHFIPVDQVCEIFEDIFGVPLSPGTCANVDKQLFANLEVFEVGLKAHLLATRVLHFDETGIRCEKKLHWVHVASSQMATLYTMHTKRGQEAMDASGILPKFQGIAIHDHWFPYFTYQQLKHGLCNAHHLRELIFVHEQEKEAWAKRMQDLLILTSKEVGKHAEQGVLSPDILLQIEQDYQQILTEGFAYHASLPPLPTSKRGKQKQRDGKNLLDRLNERRDCVLRFVHDFSVTFTNNQGERDIRMVKLKQKIGGCFRVFRGGEIFCRIRSYISTARKQDWNVWGALADAIRGSPRLLKVDQAIAVQVSAI
jgi:transposase